MKQCLRAQRAAVICRCFHRQQFKRQRFPALTGLVETAARELETSHTDRL